MADSGPLKGPDPWVHIRAHAAEGGLYACAIKELLERLQHLEARPEVQVLPTTPKDCGPTLLVPIQLQQGAEPVAPSSLVDAVAIAIARTEDAGDWGDEAINWAPEARAAILVVADRMEEEGWSRSASWLRKEVERNG